MVFDSMRRSCMTRAYTTLSARANKLHQTYVPSCLLRPLLINVPPFPSPLPTPRQLRNPLHTYRHVRPPCSAAHSLHSRTGSPLSPQCMLGGSLRSRHLPCTRAYTARRSG